MAVKDFFKPYPNRSLEDLRLVLEESRGHIDRAWVQEQYFDFDVFIKGEKIGLDMDCDNRDMTVENIHSELLADPECYDLTEEQAQEIKKEDITVTNTSLCLAGSVLYSLGYTSTQWTGQARVRAVIEELFKHLPVDSQAEAQNEYEAWLNVRKSYDQHPRKAERRKNLYDRKLWAVINWNDAGERKKQDVLDLFDKAIKGVVNRMGSV